MFRLFSRNKEPAHRPAEVPRGLRIYAIGDIHGRADLLQGIHDRIAADARDNPAPETRVIYLGDYVDRGPSSREVVEMLIARATGLPTTHLKGNHEAMLLQFLEDTTIGPEWYAYGGLATLASYGVNPRSEGNAETQLVAAQRELLDKFPASHREFLAGLSTHVSFGDYFFVHAGVRPGVPLAQQQVSDLIWIREAFLESPDFHGKIVVHGHSYRSEPELLANRIGIDTGAYATGRLTCLVLEGQSLRFL